MNDFKPIIINDIPLKVFFSQSTTFKIFYEKNHEILKTIFKIDLDIKKLYNNFYSLLATIGFNIDLQYELIDYLEEFFNNIKEDNVNNVYFKMVLLDNLSSLDCHQIIFENEMFIIYNISENNPCEVVEHSNKNSYTEVMGVLRYWYNEIDTSNINLHFVKYIDSFEIVSKATNRVTYDYYFKKDDLEGFKNEFLYYDGIQTIIEMIDFVDSEYKTLVEIAKYINSYILKENYLKIETKKDIKKLTNNEDYSFNPLNSYPKFSGHEIALLSKILKEKFRHDKNLRQYEICNNLADATGFSKTTINQNIKSISTGIKFAKQETKESLKEKLLLIVNLLNDN